MVNYKMVRQSFFVGILILALNAVSAIRNYIAFILDYDISGFKIIEIVALATAIMAIMYINKRF